MSEKIDISGLDKAEVLFALYNASEVIGMGVLQERHGVTLEDIRKVISRGDDMAREVPALRDIRGHLNFDYLFGRPIKVNLAKDFIEPDAFNARIGEGAAQRAIEKLRAEVAKREKENQS